MFSFFSLLSSLLYCLVIPYNLMFLYWTVSHVPLLTAIFHETCTFKQVLQTKEHWSCKMWKLLYRYSVLVKYMYMIHVFKSIIYCVYPPLHCLCREWQQLQKMLQLIIYVAISIFFFYSFKCLKQYTWNLIAYYIGFKLY